MSVMPMNRSAAMLSAPIGPAPKTITVSPGVTPERVMPCNATDSGSANAAWRAARPSGRRSTPPARATTYSAKAPSVWSVIMLLRFSHWDGFPSRQRRQVPHRGEVPPTTCSPIDHPATSSPRATMVPLHSWPATAPGWNPQPSRSWWMSDPQMPHACTRTTSWSGLGRGTGRSSTAITPGDRYTAAAMTSGSRLVTAPPCDPDMDVRLGALDQPGQAPGEVAQIGGRLPGPGEVPQRAVETTGEAVLDTPG